MMNLAFQSPASLFVTIGHHAVGGEGAMPPSKPQIYIFFGGGGRARKKWPFFCNVPKIKMCGNFSFLG